MNGANVTILSPYPAQATFAPPSDIRIVCLENMADNFSALMKLAWRVYTGNPIMLCLAWLVIHVRPGAYDLVYWSDFEPDNQQSTWPLGLARLVGLYRHRTAFTEHHDFSWNKHRWQRLLRLDRLRLKHIEMFVHSRRLLEGIRLIMGWPDAGHYVAHGLWPDPASNEDRYTARFALGIPSDARVLLVFGMQAIRRKGIDILADAIRGMSLNRSLIVLFAGVRVRDEPHPFDHPDLTDKLNLHILHNESFIPKEMVKSIFAAADAVWAYYGNFVGASGVLAQTIAYGRIPISSRNSESGDLCKTYRLGITTPTDDIGGVRAALEKFLTMPAITQTDLELATQGAANTMSWPCVTHYIMDIVFATNDFARPP